MCVSENTKKFDVKTNKNLPGIWKRPSKYKVIRSMDVIKVRVGTSEKKTKEEIKILKMCTELKYPELS